MLKLGSHVGMSGRKMMLGSVEEALSYGANTFMIQKTRKDLIYQAGRIDMQEAIINDLQIRLLQAEKTIKQLTQALA